MGSIVRTSISTSISTIISTRIISISSMSSIVRTSISTSISIRMIIIGVSELCVCVYVSGCT